MNVPSKVGYPIHIAVGNKCVVSMQELVARSSSQLNLKVIPLIVVLIREYANHSHDSGFDL